MKGRNPYKPFYHFYSSLANGKAFKIFMVKVLERFFYLRRREGEDVVLERLVRAHVIFLYDGKYLKIETSFILIDTFTRFLFGLFSIENCGKFYIFRERRFIDGCLFYVVLKLMLLGRTPLVEVENMFFIRQVIIFSKKIKK